MTKLGVLCSAALLTVGVVVSCAGDEQAKKAQDEEAGAAGMSASAGAGATADSGGSASEPGEGGQPPSVEGGAGGSGGVPVAQGGAGGMSSSEGGAAGGPTYDCPAQPGTFSYGCALVAANPNQQLDNWSPTFDPETNTFSLDVSSLPFPIVSGTISSIFYTTDAESCGGSPITAGDGTVSVNIGGLGGPAVTAIAITDFQLVDVCGQHHDYDPVGVACWRLTGNAEAGFQMACEGAGDPCPAECN